MTIAQKAIAGLILFAACVAMMYDTHALDTVNLTAPSCAEPGAKCYAGQ